MELQNDNMSLRIKVHRTTVRIRINFIAYNSEVYILIISLLIMLIQIAEDEEELQQVTIARSAGVELNPFAALDMKCFFPASLIEAAAAAAAQAQAQASSQRLQINHTELNLGYQLAPPGADAAHNF